MVLYIRVVGDIKGVDLIFYYDVFIEVNDIFINDIGFYYLIKCLILLIF